MPYLTILLEACNGNRAALARAFGVQRSTIGLWEKQNYIPESYALKVHVMTRHWQTPITAMDILIAAAKEKEPDWVSKLDIKH